MTLEIALGADVVMGCEKLTVGRAENVENFGFRPDVEFSLFTFGIGVERGTEGALACRHFAPEPAHRFMRAFAEQRVAGAREGKREQLEKLCVVVEHFLEMRDQPALVDRITREAAAEMIVDPAFAYSLKR